MASPPDSPPAELAAHESDAQLLALVDHDLRSPLLNLSMAVSLLTQGEPSADLNADLARIMSESIDRLGLLARDLLEFTHVRLGTHPPLDRREIDVAASIRTAVTELTPSFPNHGIEITHEGAPALGSFDPVRLVQLVRTFIGHALRCSPPRGTVRIGTRTTEDAVTVQAATDGTNAGDRGAGLYLVQQLATLHGATAHVAPAEAGGTLFTLRLPRAATA